MPDPLSGNYVLLVIQYYVTNLAQMQFIQTKLMDTAISVFELPSTFE